MNLQNKAPWIIIILFILVLSFVNAVTYTNYRRLRMAVDQFQMDSAGTKNFKDLKAASDKLLWNARPLIEKTESHAGYGIGG